MWFSWRRRIQENDTGKTACSPEVAFQLDTSGSGNVRVNFVFDTDNLVVEYKYEEGISISSRYVVFRGVTKFCFTRIDKVEVIPVGSYDAVIACDVESEKRRRFVCFFSDNGLAEIIANSAEKLDLKDHEYVEIFRNIPDNLV